MIGTLTRPKRSLQQRSPSRMVSTNLSLYFVFIALCFALAILYLSTSLTTHSSLLHPTQALQDQLSTFAVPSNVIVKNVDPDVKQHETDFRLAGLSCERYNGPSDDLAKEMVYWEGTSVCEGRTDQRGSVLMCMCMCTIMSCVVIV